MIKSFPAENKGWSRSDLSLLEKKNTLIRLIFEALPAQKKEEGSKPDPQFLAVNSLDSHLY